MNSIYIYIRKRIQDHKTATNNLGYLKSSILIREIADMYYDGTLPRKNSDAHKKMMATIKKARESVKNEMKYLNRNIQEWSGIIECSPKTMARLIRKNIVRKKEHAIIFDQILMEIFNDMPEVMENKFHRIMHQGVKKLS